MRYWNAEGVAYCLAALLPGSGSQTREADNVADGVNVIRVGLIRLVGFEAATRIGAQSGRSQLSALVALFRPMLRRALSVTICLPLARQVRTLSTPPSSKTSMEATSSPRRKVTRRSRI